MSATSSSIRSTLSLLASRWPSDPLRPSMQFSAALQSAIERSVPTTTASLTPSQIARAQSMAASVDRLLSDAALKRHPMGPKTLQPSSFPKHYSRIKDGVDRARKGEIIKPPTWRERFFVWR